MPWGSRTHPREKLNHNRSYITQENNALDVTGRGFDAVLGGTEKLVVRGDEGAEFSECRVIRKI